MTCYQFKYLLLVERWCRAEIPFKRPSYTLRMQAVISGELRRRLTQDAEYSYRVVFGVVFEVVHLMLENGMLYDVSCFLPVTFVVINSSIAKA